MILAIESATSRISVALLRGERVLRELASEDARPPSERLLPALDALLRAEGVRLDAVEAFAVSIGPGSFTGLRVGVATAKGLAFASGRKVAAVPTLAALALPALGAGAPVAAILDARRGEVYAALFAPGGELLLPDAVLAPGALAQRLPEGTRLVVGEGGGPAAEAIARSLGSRVRVLAAPHGAAGAGAVGVLGARALARGEGLAAAALAPRYVRRAEAEARRTGRPFEPL